MSLFLLISPIISHEYRLLEDITCAKDVTTAHFNICPSSALIYITDMWIVAATLTVYLPLIHSETFGSNSFKKLFPNASFFFFVSSPSFFTCWYTLTFYFYF